jgi:HNH endonuclease/AP2 domain
VSARVIEIPLSRGLVALIDEDDFDQVASIGKWYADKSTCTFYARKNYWRDGRCFSIKMHRFITGLPFVDHVNGNGLDNRRSNLRTATDSQNSMNRGRRSDNTSGYKGVSWNRQCQSWEASICMAGKSTYLGLFSAAKTAARAYDMAAIATFGEYARLNFPEESAHAQ